MKIALTTWHGHTVTTVPSSSDWEVFGSNYQVLLRGVWIFCFWSPQRSVFLRYEKILCSVALPLLRSLPSHLRVCLLSTSAVQHAAGKFHFLAMSSFFFFPPSLSLSPEPWHASAFQIKDRDVSEGGGFDGSWKVERRRVDVKERVMCLWTDDEWEKTCHNFRCNFVQNTGVMSHF